MFCCWEAVPEEGEVELRSKFCEACRRHAQRKDAEPVPRDRWQFDVFRPFLEMCGSVANCCTTCTACCNGYVGDQELTLRAQKEYVDKEFPETDSAHEKVLQQDASQRELAHSQHSQDFDA